MPDENPAEAAAPALSTQSALPLSQSALPLPELALPLPDLDVLVVGDVNPDLILRGDVVPRFGQSEQLLDSADLIAGGSGAIVAHGLARLGVRTGIAAVVGDDTFGELSRAQLAAAGVDVSQLRTDPDRPTGLSVILTRVDSDNRDSRTMLTLIGSIGALDPAHVDDALLRRVRHVHASSFYLQPKLAAGLAELFGRAHAAGASTSLDTNIDPAGEWQGLAEVLPVTDILLPNRTEILGIGARYGASVAGGEDHDLDLVAAARAIAAHGPLVVVKDGERGAIAVPGPGADVIRSAGIKVAAIDSTGAGDSFDAAFISGHVRGLGLAASLALACRAGALSTLGVGGTATQATLAQLTGEVLPA